MRPLNSKEAQALGLEAPKPKKRKKTKAEIEQERRAFILAAKAYGLPEPEPEFRFHPTRLWRFDWVWHQGAWGGVAVEIQGGLFVKGRHTQGAALINEYEKLREAQILGYKVMPVTPKQVESGEVFSIVRRAMGR